MAPRLARIFCTIVLLLPLQNVALAQESAAAATPAVPLSDDSFKCNVAWNTAFTRADFPSDFVFGAATAAYQIEGTTAGGGRGPCIWDAFVKIPGKIVNGDTADVADDSYRLWEKDVALLKQMGVDSYRFSISWSRILPNGTGAINQEGVNYYNSLINALIKENITPAVTLYHWDLPLTLDTSYGGWLNARSADDFLTYADVCFKYFGDRVKTWVTFNEPQQTANQGYANGAMAPGRCSDRSVCAAGNSSIEPYLVAHNILRAHGKAVALYRSTYKGVQGGRVGITLDSVFFYALNNTAESHAAAQRGIQFSYGWFANVVVFGDYPAVMRKLVNERLPLFTAEERATLKGGTDFLGLNSYTAAFASQSSAPGPGGGSPYTDGQVITSSVGANGKKIGLSTASSWLFRTPKALYSMVLWIHRTYPGYPILITENGTSDLGNSTIPLAQALCDQTRVAWYHLYLAQLLKAIKEGAPVEAFYAWSLQDNFEWARGYSERFGLHYVDFTDPARPRYPKMSALWYQYFLSV